MDTTPDATEPTGTTTQGGGEPAVPLPPPPPAAFETVRVERPAPSSPPVNGRGIALGFGLALLAAIVVLQAITVAAVSGQGDEVTALRNELAAVSGSVGNLSGDLSALGERVDAINTDGASSVDGAAAAPTGIPGGLPPYQGPGTEDTALGTVVPAVTGPEWYSSTEVTVTPGDGTARVYLVWAHWCPFCQQDLDVLRTWWPENASRFPDTALVSVTTFQDDTRSNPLDAYLETSAFDFPVLVDDTQATLALTLGNGGSVPYWVFTDGDGAVVGRHAGLLEQDQIENVFSQLQELATGA